MSSPYLSTSPQYPRFYKKDQSQVQQVLIQLIDIQYLPALQAVFKAPEWLFENQPLNREDIKVLPQGPRDKGVCLCVLHKQIVRAIDKSCGAYSITLWT